MRTMTLNALPQSFRTQHVPGCPAPRPLSSLMLNLAQPSVLQPSSHAASESQSKILYKPVSSPTTNLTNQVSVCGHLWNVITDHLFIHYSSSRCAHSLPSFYLRSLLPVHYSYIFCYTLWIPAATPPSTHSFVLSCPFSVEYCTISQPQPPRRKTRIAKICRGQIQTCHDLFLPCAQIECLCPQ